MRPILTILFYLVVILNGFTQNELTSQEHMKFKGIPIDGTLKDFVLKLEKKGFTYEKTEEGIAWFGGEFASYNNCIIAVVSLKQKDLVCKTIVLFPDKDTWSSLSNNYFFLKELLTEKYGEPSKVVEKFDSSIQPSDDEDRMRKVKSYNCKYYTNYITDKGKIQLTIYHSEKDLYSSCFVRLSYYDKINGEIIRQKALNDL
ncbi:hypothetical protein FHR24_001569 [Wenyingzhuangia heitensis]|uniref:Uncharacterized protein n=1 Tax=Wenyingzhuangia heitensis TaxID=1487859 RepID=A0ABX0UBC3_9FLAO|nr:hypothetical protein [Wenyingzhuangia heitensis]NIJ45130.1 hypothetical protein [Wenyingzhuangia heitensis]